MSLHQLSARGLGTLLPVSLALGTGSIALVAETLAYGKKDACCCMGRVGVFARSPLVGPRLRVVRSPLLIFLLEGL